MSTRSLNKVMLIGNLTRDPELRYTPQGTAVCTIGLATNRSWTNDSGEKSEDVEFHRLVAWSKLAEICGQLLKKGRKMYAEGRLQTREWTTQDGQKRQTTEVVIENMILLDSSGRGDGDTSGYSYSDDSSSQMASDDAQSTKSSKKSTKKSTKADESVDEPEPPVAEDVSDDIPF